MPPLLTAKIDPSTATLIGATVGAMIAVFGAAVIRYLLDRRGERDRIRGIARLLELELQDVQTTLERLGESGAPVVRLPRLNCPAWEEHRDVFATELDNTALSALHYVFRWLDRPAKPVPGFGRIFRSPGVFMRTDELFILTQTTALALSAVGTVRSSGGKLIRRTGDRYAAAPSLRAPCKCGHAFGEHQWKTVKRRLRAHHRHVKRVDRAGACNECGCEKFVLFEESWLKSMLRRLRLIDQAPSLYPERLGREPEGDETVVSEVLVKSRGETDLVGIVQIPNRG